MSGTASIAAMSDRLLTAIFCFSSTLRRRRRLGDHLQGRAGFDTLLLSASIFLRSGLSVMAVFKTETILHKAVRDVGKEPDLSEKAQGLGVIGYGARQAEKAAIALEDGDPKAGQPKQVRCQSPRWGRPRRSRRRILPSERLLRRNVPSAVPSRKIDVAHLRQID